MMEGEQVTLGQDDKKWDRVWSTDEIRKNSANWTLAGDVGLFNLLNEVSQNIISRTHEVQNAVDSLVHNTKMVSVKVNNIMNDFHMLSNLQFVENRVYDEEVRESVPDTKPVEKTKEQREAEMLPKIVKALELGMSVLDKAFNKINVNEISDSEDEDLSSEGRTILEPKNPYEHRPLPLIIGSEEFMSDEYAGLKDLIQEDVESSVESESSTTDSDETSSSEDELPLDDGKFSGIPTPRKEAQSVSDRYSSSEESELFGVEKEENGFISDSSIEPKPKETIVQKPAEEPKTAVRDSRQSSISSMQSKLNLPQVLPTPKHAQKKKESEDLFTNDDEFSDEDSPFRRKTGLFASEPRFDDDKDMFDSDLFGSKTKEVAKPVESLKAPLAQKPPSAIPKSKEPDLFGDDEDSDDDIFNKLTRAKKPTLPKESFVSKLESPDKADSSSTPSSAPSVRPSGNAFDFGTGAGTADALFGDDSDGDDLFSSKKTTTTTTTTIKKFAFDDDEDDDLFGLTNEKKTTKSKAPEKKKPTEVEKAPPLIEAGASGKKSYKKLGMPLPGLVTKPKDSIFEDSDSSDQGDKKASALPQPTKEKKEISLFDDDDEEDDIFSQKPKLFSPGKSPSVKNKPEDSATVKTEKEVVKKETPATKETAPSLFDDFEEDDKAVFSVPAKKADTSLFEESDTFDLFKPKVVEKKKAEPIKFSPVLDVKPALSITAIKKADTSLFEESDSFDLFKPKEKQNVEPIKSTPAPVSKPSEASLFSSADESDGGTSTKLTKPSSPVKNIQEVDDGLAGFDAPADSSKTLNVISKDRAKIATKRRKPTRKGRLAALESSDPDKTPEPAPPPPTNNSLGSSDDLFSNEEPETQPAPKPVATHKSQEKKRMDLMSQLMSEAASSKVLKKAAMKVEEEEDVVDIFAELDGKRDVKSQSFSFKSPIESSVTSKSDFLEDDKTNGVEEVASVLVSEEAEDDFFSEPSFRKFSHSIPKKDPILDMDDDDDDLFNIKPSSVLKPKTDTSEVDLFADETDIFADLPKEKYEMFPSQLYDDEDDDDIFSIASSTNKADKSTKATVPVKKEAEKKTVKEVEKKPAFEDPLTGLLGGD